MLRRYVNNPILKPLADHSWESLAVCNPGAWYEKGIFYLLYRAAGNSESHQIHLGLALSSDGYRFKRVSDSPVFSPSPDGPDAGCVEDPRIVKFDDTFYITYAYRPFPPGRYWTFARDKVIRHDVGEAAPRYYKNNSTLSGLALSKDLRSFRRLGRITCSTLDNRDVILFPEKVNNRFVLLHRPKEWVGRRYGCDFPGIWISFSDDLLQWRNDKLLARAEYPWEEKIGGSAPPLKTAAGWLFFYHAVDGKGIYRIGVMLLDPEDPSRIIARSPRYIMEPEHDYETRGIYNNCVFPTGNVVVEETLYLYYGGADQYCCLATCGLKEMTDFVLQYKQ